MRLIILLVCLLDIIQVTGQTCSTITGRVLDATTGEMLPGASIVVNGSDGQLALADGSFALPSSQGDTLHITFIGYEPISMTVHTCDTVVRLRPLATAISEVVIESDKLISEDFAIRKLTKLEVYTNPSAKADPILAVNAMPFATTTDESANVSLRGGSPAETGVFLNDVPIEDAVRYSQLNGVGTFSIFNTALIDEVQVYPGNPPLEFGSSTSGIISLTTEEQLPTRKSTQISATLASLGVYHTRKTTAKSSLTTFSNLQSSALFTYVNEKAMRDLKSFFSYDLGVHYLAHLSQKTTIKIFNYSLREAYRYNYTHPTLEGIFRQDRVRNFSVANVHQQWSKFSLTLNKGLSFSRSGYNFNSLDIKMPSHDYYAALNLHYMSSLFQWKTGIVYDHKQMATEGTYPAYSYAYGNQFGSKPVDKNKDIGGIEFFGYLKTYLGNLVTVGVGLRKNLPRHDVGYLSWQGNFNVRPARHWNINASAGDFHKLVLQRDGDSNGYLLHSRQLSLDLGYKNRRLDFATSLFYKRIHRGSLSERVSGAELYGRYKFDESWRAQFSVTTLRAHDDHGNATPYNISYFVRGNVEYRLKGMWTFTLVFLIREGSYYNAVDRTIFHENSGLYEPVYDHTPSRLPGYNTIDISASRIFMLNAKTTAIAFLNVANVADFRNVRSYSYNYDYTTRREQYFSQRVVYFGMLLSF